uniref:Transcriptional regulator n=1 Tax=Heterorhabditis bacteriophora TaxID=37862 RepID=A0A1I7WT75_HETBA
MNILKYLLFFLDINSRLQNFKISACLDVESKNELLELLPHERGISIIQITQLFNCKFSYIDWEYLLEKEKITSGKIFRLTC